VRTGVPLARPWRLGRLRTGLRWRINDGALLMNLISRTAFGEADNNDLDDALYMNQVLRFRAEIRPNRFRYQSELLFFIW
jgi:hypothetical protein